MQTLVFLLFVGALSAWVWFQPMHRRARRLATPGAAFPPAWQETLQTIPLYQHLPEALRERLQQRVLLFLTARRFIGCHGIEVTDAMRVTIAAQACVLALGPVDDPWPELDTILVHPGVFLSPRQIEHEGGVVEEEVRELEGESWSGRQVVLAWTEVEAGAADPHDGVNVVIHEFAHQLDTLDEGTGGLPLLPASVSLEEWSSEWTTAFGRLCREVQTRGEQAWLDPAASENAGEFLAYACEVFVECPWVLEEQEPALYDLLRRVLGIDPLDWTCPEAAAPG
jgi:MtfA peptidase